MLAHFTVSHPVSSPARLGSCTQRVKNEDRAAGHPVFMGLGCGLEPCLVPPGGFVKTRGFGKVTMEETWEGWEDLDAHHLVPTGQSEPI